MWNDELQLNRVNQKGIFFSWSVHINTNVVCRNFYLLKLLKDFFLRIFFSSVNVVYKNWCNCGTQDCLQLLRQLYSPKYILWIIIVSWQMKIHGGTILGHYQSLNETNHMERVKILSFKSRSKKSLSLKFWQNGLFTLGIVNSQIN